MKRICNLLSNALIVMGIAILLLLLNSEGTISIVEGGDVPVIIDLGTLGGTSSGAFAINNAGQVVGYSGTASGEYRAFLWTLEGGMVDLGTLGGFISTAYAINNTGQVVGVSINASGENHAFLWSPDGGMIDLGTLGGSYSRASAINDAGQVVGNSTTVTLGMDHAFRWSPDGGMIDLGTLGGFFSTAAAINDTGQVVGYSGTASGKYRAFLWSPDGGMMDLGSLGGSYSRASAINDAGQVIGVSTLEDHAFLWSPDGGMIDLGTLGGSYSTAAAINNAGQVVGVSSNASGEDHAFLWSPDGGMMGLGTLGGTSSAAKSINNIGQVVGVSTIASGERRAFLWTPEGGMIDLGTPPGCIDSRGAYAINDAGQIIGNNGNASRELRATFWQVTQSTSSGINITVRPQDHTTGERPAVLTFDEVTKPGYTSLTTSGEGDPPPQGFMMGDPPTYYELSTTATYTGTIKVCIDYSRITFAGNEEYLGLYHLEDGQWVDVTVLPVNTVGDVICGTVTSLSPFAIFEPGINQPPVAVCRNVTVNADENCHGSSSIDGGSYDPDNDPIAIDLTPAGPYGLGTTDVVLTVTDSYGASDSCTNSVTVQDNEPPVIEGITATPDVLWPPNHKMVPVTVAVMASDSCGLVSPKIVSVTITEPQDGTSNSGTSPDWEITGDLTVNLRTERSGSGNGRYYTISVECMDEAGNTSSADVMVSAPHDQGKAMGKK